MFKNILTYLISKIDLLYKSLYPSDKNNLMKEILEDYSKKENKLSTYNGTIYAVVGSSSKVDAGPLDHPAMPHAYQQAGSMVIDVDNNVLKAYFINKTGKVIDQFEIIKGVATGSDSRSCQ